MGAAWHCVTDDAGHAIAPDNEKELVMTISAILLILLVLLLVGALPAWPYSTGWGYWPSGGLGLVVLVVVLLVLMGRI
jgi:membrane protein YdbS with pleckstrin-like domain